CRGLTASSPWPRPNTRAGPRKALGPGTHAELNSGTPSRQVPGNSSASSSRAARLRAKGHCFGQPAKNLAATCEICRKNARIVLGIGRLGVFGASPPTSDAWSEAGSATPGTNDFAFAHPRSLWLTGIQLRHFGSKTPHAEIDRMQTTR